MSINPQAIVVLGGDIRRGAPDFGGDTVGPLTLERVRYAAKLHRETALPILVTGKLVAIAMKEALNQDFGVEVQWIEPATRTTLENAIFSRLCSEMRVFAGSIGSIRAAHCLRVMSLSKPEKIPMTEHEFNQAVWNWLNSLPGTVEDGCSDGVVRKAWGQFGHGGLEAFRAALAFHGFKPEPIGRKFILRLPSKPIAGADTRRIRRLHNIAAWVRLLRRMVNRGGLGTDLARSFLHRRAAWVFRNHGVGKVEHSPLKLLICRPIPEQKGSHSE